MIPIAKPNFDEKERQAVLEVLDSGVLVQGAKTKAFEDAFARYVDRKHGIATCNGTAALHVALLAYGIGKGDEVIVPPITFFASAATVLHCGARVRFSDVERDTYTIDPAKLRRTATTKTRAVMPVHLFGQTADMDPIREFAAERDLLVIEDACQAHGAEYKGKKAGALGQTACFSFYPTKNMTTTEGGMIVTDDAEVAERCRRLRDQGQSAKYVHDLVGFNLRMTEVAAAIGLIQLSKLDGFVRRRRDNARFLTERLQGLRGLVPPAERPVGVHAYYQYVVRVEKFPLDRDGLVKFLNDRGIGSRPSYPVPVYAQPALAGTKARHCPVAERVLPRLLELPVHPLVSDADREVIAEAVRAAARI